MVSNVFCAKKGKSMREFLENEIVGHKHLYTVIRNALPERGAVYVLVKAPFKKPHERVKVLDFPGTVLTSVKEGILVKIGR